MKTLWIICMLGISWVIYGQGIRDTSFTVKNLFKIRLANQDADVLIKNDYILVEVENLTRQDIYFYNISTDTRQSLPRYEKDNVNYIQFGSIIPENAGNTIEIYKLGPAEKVICLFTQPSREKGIVINYIDKSNLIQQEKKKYFIKNSDYKINMLTERVILIK